MLDAARAMNDARDLRIDSYILEVKAAKLRATDTEETARLAGARAAEREAAAQVVEERVVTAKERAAAAERKSIAAEERTVAAEGRAARAVDDFRRSASFEDELAEAFASAYLLGFQDGKEKVGRVLSLTGLEDIEPNEALEGPTASLGPTGDGSEPTELGPADDGPALAEA